MLAILEPRRLRETIIVLPLTFHIISRFECKFHVEFLISNRVICIHRGNTLQNTLFSSYTFKFAHSVYWVFLLKWMMMILNIPTKYDKYPTNTILYYPKQISFSLSSTIVGYLVWFKLTLNQFKFWDTLSCREHSLLHQIKSYIIRTFYLYKKNPYELRHIYKNYILTLYIESVFQTQKPTNLFIALNAT